jgi:cytochrome b
MYDTCWVSDYVYDRIQRTTGQAEEVATNHGERSMTDVFWYVLALLVVLVALGVAYLVVMAVIDDIKERWSEARIYNDLIERWKGK